MAAPQDEDPLMAGYIYALGVEGLSLVKIGYAQDVSKRIAQLQTGLPYTLVLLYQERVEDPRGLEAIVHSLVQDRRHRGEWFELEGISLSRLMAEGKSLLAEKSAQQPAASSGDEWLQAEEQLAILQGEKAGILDRPFLAEALQMWIWGLEDINYDLVKWILELLMILHYDPRYHDGPDDDILFRMKLAREDARGAMDVLPSLYTAIEGYLTRDFLSFREEVCRRHNWLPCYEQLTETCPWNLEQIMQEDFYPPSCWRFAPPSTPGGGGPYAQAHPDGTQ